MQVDGLAGHERGDAIEQRRYEQMKVNASPGPAAPPPHQQQSRRQHQFFANVKQIKTSAVHGFDRVHILPGNHDEEIQKQPPRQQQREIERSNSHRAIILLHMRLDRHRRHHRNNVQKENYIANKRIRRLVPQVDFEISPHELARPATSPSRGP